MVGHEQPILQNTTQAVAMVDYAAQQHFQIV